MRLLKGGLTDVNLSTVLRSCSGEHSRTTQTLES